MSTATIIHEPENERFIIPLQGNDPAELDYAIRTDHSRDPGRSVVNFTRTYVPQEHRNKGLAEQLVRHGLAWPGRVIVTAASRPAAPMWQNF